MENDKKISIAVIKRLPRYYRYLGDLLDAGILRISSKELSDKMGITASQIRQDLNNFGGFGQQGYGYNVEYLYEEIKKIIGLEKRHNIIIVGAGNIGQALANYTNFERRGFYITAMFDVNPKIIGMTIRGIPVYDMDEMDKFCREKAVDIAILTVPANNANQAALKLEKLGVRGIWNFSPVDLDLGESETMIENVHLSDSLMTLSYRLNESFIKKYISS